MAPESSKEFDLATFAHDREPVVCRLVMGDRTPGLGAVVEAAS